MLGPYLVDVRALVRQTVSLEADHEVGPGGRRRSVEDLLQVYELDDALAEPAPTAIGILDDVLTNGTHFKAMQTILGQRYPGVRITGLFIARRVFAEPPNPFG